MPASPEDGERLASRIGDLVAELEGRLLRQMATALAEGIDDEDGWEQRKLLQLRLLQQRLSREVTDADTDLADQVLQVIGEANARGAALALNDLDEVGVDLPRVPPIDPAVTIATETTAVTSQALSRVPTLLTRVYRQAVQAGVNEVLGGAVTRRAASQHVLDRLASKGIDGFVDRAGRNWSLTSYCEMAVRTGAGQAAVQGHVDALTEAGLDLVVVSDSPRECPECRPWEGKVLSLSGVVGATIVPSATGPGSVRVDVAGTLAEAKSAGLQHPNCTHSVSAYVPGATRRPPAKADPAGYDAKQRQRALERKVREWKRRQAVALDDAAAARAGRKVRDWQGQLRDHIDDHDLKRLRYREQIPLELMPRRVTLRAPAAARYDGVPSMRDLAGRVADEARPNAHFDETRALQVGRSLRRAGWDVSSVRRRIGEGQRTPDAVVDDPARGRRTMEFKGVDGTAASITRAIRDGRRQARAVAINAGATPLTEDELVRVLNGALGVYGAELDEIVLIVNERTALHWLRD